MLQPPSRLREPGFASKRPNGSRNSSVGRESGGGGSLPPIRDAGSPGTKQQPGGGARSASVGRLHASSPRCRGGGGGHRESSLPPLGGATNGGTGGRHVGSPPEPGGGGMRPPRPDKQNGRSQMRSEEPVQRQNSRSRMHEDLPPQRQRSLPRVLDPIDGAQEQQHLPTKTGAGGYNDGPSPLGAKDRSSSRGPKRDGGNVGGGGTDLTVPARRSMPEGRELEPLPAARSGGHGRSSAGALRRAPAAAAGGESPGQRSEEPARRGGQPPRAPVQRHASEASPALARSSSGPTRQAASPTPAVCRPASPPIRPASPPVPAVSATPGGVRATPSEAAFGGAEMGGMEDEVEEDVELLPCPHCTRKFRPQAHEKHLKICVKVFQNQRKAYDVTAHRVPEEALQQLSNPKQNKKAQAAAEKAAAAKANWRIKSEAFRAAMKDAKVVDQYKKEGRSLADLPPPKPTAPELDDRTPCPHCGRRFGQNQADRHIPKCAESKAKGKAKAKPKAGGRR